MRKIMAPLVIAIMLMATACLGFAVMVSYSGNYKANARKSELQTQVTALKAKKDRLSTFDGKGEGFRTAGVELLEQEVGKSNNLLKDIETKRFAVAREPLNKEIANRRKELSDSAAENLKAGETDLREKLRAAKELRLKVEQGQKDLAAARQKNQERENAKAELANRLAQQEHLLDRVRARDEQVAALLKLFEADAGKQP